MLKELPYKSSVMCIKLLGEDQQWGSFLYTTFVHRENNGFGNSSRRFTKHNRKGVIFVSNPEHLSNLSIYDYSWPLTLSPWTFRNRKTTEVLL